MRHDRRSDVYGAGTLLYRALSNALPFEAKNVLQLVHMKAKQTPRVLSRALEAGVPAGLDAFFVRCLARDPAERFPSAVEAGAAWAALAAPTA